MPSIFDHYVLPWRKRRTYRESIAYQNYVRGVCKPTKKLAAIRNKKGKKNHD
jgi:hypothetical protein